MPVCNKLWPESLIIHWGLWLAALRQVHGFRFSRLSSSPAGILLSPFMLFDVRYTPSWPPQHSFVLKGSSECCPQGQWKRVLRPSPTSAQEIERAWNEVTLEYFLSSHCAALPWGSEKRLSHWLLFGGSVPTKQVASKVVLLGVKRVPSVCSFGTGINARRLCCRGETRGVMGTEDEDSEGTGLLCEPVVESELSLESRMKPVGNDWETRVAVKESEKSSVYIPSADDFSVNSGHGYGRVFHGECLDTMPLCSLPRLPHPVRLSPPYRPHTGGC